MALRQARAMRPAAQRTFGGACQKAIRSFGRAAYRNAADSLGGRRAEGPIQQAAEGRGVGQTVNEEVEGGEADEGPAQGRDTGDDEDGAGEGDDAEDGVGAQEGGWVFSRAFGLKRRDKVAMEPAGEAPGGAYRAGCEHQHDERHEPGGGQGPGDHERETKGSGHDQLVEAALAAISHGQTPASATFQELDSDGGSANGPGSGAERTATARQTLSVRRIGCQTLGMAAQASGTRALHDAW